MISRTSFTLAAIAVTLAVRVPGAQEGTAGVRLESSPPGTTVNARVLLIAAHPDDEDTQLITWLARGRGVKTAYLSITRGDGGQNLIGNELGEPLGVIRTEELLAARRVDGAHQYFTRAYDFGFSKNAAETFSHWPKEELLGDVVKVVRAFRPQIMVAIFSGTPRDGHGQHQVSAILAREAYDAAPDTIRFPMREFGPGWTPLKFYRSARFSPNVATLAINVGEYNPMLGKSYAELAAESRSQHKSQGFGTLRRRGVVWDYLTREHTRVDTSADVKQETSIFAGLPAENRTATATATFSDEDPALVFEAIADRQVLALGDSARVTMTLYNRSRNRVSITGKATGGNGPMVAATVLPDSTYRWVEYARGTEVTQPWWLAAPRSGDLFTPPIDAISEDERVKRRWADVIIQPSPGSGGLMLRAPVVFHYVDPVRGDIQRPLIVAPGISVTFDRTVDIARASSPLDRFVNVTLRSAFTDTASVAVSLELPAGLVADSVRRVVALAPGATRAVTFKLRGRLPRGSHEIRAVAEARGQRFRSGYVPIEYEHIDPERIYRPSTLAINAIDVVLPRGLNVGYVPGVGDNVAPMLEQLGVPITIIQPQDIPATNLSRFSTIVVGPRAYQATQALIDNNSYLLSFARNGGRLVVQYGQYEMHRPGLMPYPIALRRPHDRVTDENAPVTLLDPTSPLLRAPNRISALDFQGWVQERALYMPHTFDAHYHPLLAMSDPGEAPNRGALLVAAYGRGTYVYVPLALFRQLPAGVPGAARIFANLLGGNTIK